MRPTVRPESLVERLALRFNLAPVPVGETMFSMPTARAVMAGVRLGLFERLARSPAGTEELAGELGLQADGTRLLLESLGALGHVHREGEQWLIDEQSRRWLDPASDRYVGTFITHSYDYWNWWNELERVVQTGKAIEIHDYPPDDPHWSVYIRGQWELARLSAPEVARALHLPREPRALLDVAGAHGWFSAELCRRHQTLQATVIDLPGSVAAGREIIAEAGMSDRVRHVEGDMMTSDLGGPYDGALLFNIIHHLAPDQIVTLFRRVRSALAPGGTLAVLDLFTRPPDERPDSAAFLGLFFYLTSGAGTYSPDELAGWLAETGFGRPRKVTIRSIPGQSLFETHPEA